MNIRTRYENIFDCKGLLNPFREDVMLFKADENIVFKEGNLVIVDPKTLIATLPKKAKGYVSVGRVVETFNREDGTKMVICKDGIFTCKNTAIIAKQFTEKDIGAKCYFENNNTVSKDRSNATMAGIIISIYDDDIILRITPRRKCYGN